MSLEALPQNKNEFNELNPEGNHTILLVGGITEGVATQSALAEALANEDFRVISFDYVAQPDESKLPGLHNARYHSAKINQTAEILEKATPEEQKTTLFAHSQGAVMAVEAALRHPDKVDRVILSNPTGLFPDSFARLAGRFSLETVRKSLTLKREAQRQQVEGVKRITKEPGDFFGDAIDIASSDIREKLKQLKELGIKVDLVVSAKDQVFPWRLQKEYFDGQDKEQFDFDSVSTYFNTKENGKQHKLASKYAGHDQPIIYPEQTAKLIKQQVAENGVVTGIGELNTPEQPELTQSESQITYSRHLGKALEKAKSEHIDHIAARAKRRRAGGHLESTEKAINAIEKALRNVHPTAKFHKKERLNEEQIRAEVERYRADIEKASPIFGSDLEKARGIAHTNTGRSKYYEELSPIADRVQANAEAGAFAAGKFSDDIDELTGEVTVNANQKYIKAMAELIDQKLQEPPTYDVKPKNPYEVKTGNGKAKKIQEQTDISKKRLEKLRPEVQILLEEVPLRQLSRNIANEIKTRVHAIKDREGITRLPADQFSVLTRMVREELLQEYIGEQEIPDEVIEEIRQRLHAIYLQSQLDK